MTLMEAGQYALACAKLQQSLALEAAMGTRFQLAECHAKIGRFASAWEGYVAVAEEAAAAGQPDKEGFARERATATRPRVCTLTIHVPAEIAGLPGFRLKRGDVAVAPAAFGQPVPTDPARYLLSAEADGYTPWTAEIAVTGEGKSAVVTVGPLQVVVTVQPPTQVVPPTPRETQRDPDAGVSPWVVSGLVLGGVGVAAVGVGVALGFAAKGQYDTAVETHCTELGCTAQGVEDGEQARTLGGAATGLIIAGAVVAAGGIAMWLFAPDDEPEQGGVALGVGLTARGLGVEVAW